MGEADTISERVRFDDNVSFIDADADYNASENTNTQTERIIASEEGNACGINSQTHSDNTSIKSHEFYGYDNVVVVNDETIPVAPRIIKVWSKLLHYIMIEFRLYYWEIRSKSS